MPVKVCIIDYTVISEAVKTFNWGKETFNKKL